MPSAARLRLFYFLYYGGVGASLPYFAPYLRGLGFTGEQIGTAQMMAPLVAAPSAIVWATVADRLATPTRALRVASSWALLAVLALPFARTPAAVAAVLLLQALGASSVVPLVDSVSMELARARPGVAYARLRLFGSLGFIALAQGVGIALAARGDRPGDVVVPLVIVACVAGYALAARGLPSAPSPEPRPTIAETSALLRDPRLVVLLVGCAAHWAACAPFHLLYGVFVRDQRLPSSITGLGMAVGVGAEVLALLAFPRLSRRLSLRALFAAAFAGTAIRWAIMSATRGAAAAIALQVFHGLTFGVFWGAAVDAMAIVVPPRLRATGQALFTAVVFGAGNAVGYQFSGIGYDRLGEVGPLYGWAAALELLPLGLALGFAGKLAHVPAPGPRNFFARRMR